MSLDLMEQACQEYYRNRVKESTPEAAIKKSKGANWVCKVKTPKGEEFYTVTYFRERWVHADMVLGMWNELTLLYKF